MKKRIIPIIVCLVVAACFALAGCGGDSFSKIKVTGTQDTSYTVYSQGGNAVQYGNYVYFINGSSGYEDTDGKQNTWPNVVKGGLYRAELCGVKDGGDFVISKNETAIEKGLEFKATAGVDYYENPVDVVDVQRIAPKRIGTTGYKQGGIFVYDNWVYFASPNNEKNKSGTVQTTKTDFFRARLDGGKVQKIYTTSASSNESNPYAFYKYDGAVYLVAQDGTDVVSVRVGKKPGKKVTIAQNVTNVYLPYSDTYYEGMNENTLNHFVYILRGVTEDDSQRAGNVIEIMRPDGKSGGVYLAQGRTDTIEAVRDGLLFYRTVSDAGYTMINYDNLHDFLMERDEDYKAYQEKLDGYKNSAKDSAEYAEYVANSRKNISGTVYSAKTVNYTSTYCFRPTGELSEVVYMLGIKSGAADLCSNVDLKNNARTMNISQENISILNVAGEYIYYTLSDATDIYRTRWDMPYSEKTEAEKSVPVSKGTVSSSIFNGDYCAGYIVYIGEVDEWADAYTFFKQVDRVAVGDNEGADPVFVGKKISDDIKPEDDEEEETEETQE